MPSKADIEIVCIPPNMIGDMWPHIGPLLLRGQLEITRGDLKTAFVRTSIIAAGACEKTMQVWAVFDNDDDRVIACMVSEIREEDGQRIVWVQGMAGEGITRWGKAMSDRMARFALDEGCDCYRFAGRKALLRAYRDVRIIGEHEDGVHLFERAAS
jgi:hypothetical protein